MKSSFDWSIYYIKYIKSISNSTSIVHCLVHPARPDLVAHVTPQRPILHWIHLFQPSKTSTPVTINSLDHLVLTVRSIPDTVAFYTTHLGMKHEVFTSPLSPTVSRYGRARPSRHLIQSLFSCDFINFIYKRHALLFGSQKINLHESGREFEPKAENVQPGSGDLCFLSDQSVERVLEYFNSVNIEVRSYCIPDLSVCKKGSI